MPQDVRKCVVHHIQNKHQEISRASPDRQGISLAPSGLKMSACVCLFIVFLCVCVFSLSVAVCLCVGCNVFSVAIMNFFCLYVCRVGAFSCVCEYLLELELKRF